MFATDCPPDMMWDGFFRLVGTDNAEVSGTASFGNGQDWNEIDGVGPGNQGSTLCQAMNLGSIGLLPHDAIGARTELFVFCQFTSVGIKCIAMECRMVCRSTGWAMVSMCCMEARGTAWFALAMGSQGHGDGGGWLKLVFGAIIHGDGGIIGMRGWKGHPQ